MAGFLRIAVKVLPTTNFTCMIQGTNTHTICIPIRYVECLSVKVDIRTGISLCCIVATPQISS